jgi:methylmalonyl-CoA/ethylmalonyl-CoA epimerase
MDIDHVGVAVKDIEASIKYYVQTFGLKVVHREDVESQNVKVAFLAGETKGTTVELLEPTSPDSAVGKFIEKKGGGLHHLAFHTEKIEGEMELLRAAGQPPLSEKPRVGARGHKVCFIHPKHAEGVLVELVSEGGGAK